MELSERLPELRKQKNISQEELANAIGVSRQAVSKWESGQSNPELDNIVSLSDYFGVTTDCILKGEQGGRSRADGDGGGEGNDARQITLKSGKKEVFKLEISRKWAKERMGVILTVSSAIFAVISIYIFLISSLGAIVTAAGAAFFIAGNFLLSGTDKFRLLRFIVKYLYCSTVIYVLMTFILEQVVRVDLWPRIFQFTAVFFFIAALGGISVYLYRMIQRKRAERSHDDIQPEIPAQENAQ